jgi:thiol-disulfide isomerase/thioredoxin
MRMKEYFEKNPESIPYLERLENEWRQHGKIIIACDYDDTISHWKLKDYDPSRTIEILKIAKQTGAYIVIFTACNPLRYEEIKSYCASIGLEIDSINETPIDLPYGKDKKIYANIFIDDRAGLNESLNILEFAMYRIRGSKGTVFSDF